MINYRDKLIEYNNIVQRYTVVRSLYPNEERPKSISVRNSVFFTVLDGAIIISYKQQHIPEWGDVEHDPSLDELFFETEYTHVFTVAEQTESDLGKKSKVSRDYILTFESDLISTLVGLVYSTMRGIIKEKLAGTSESHFVMVFAPRTELFESSNWSKLTQERVGSE